MTPSFKYNHYKCFDLSLGGLKSYQKLAGLEFHDKSDKYRVRITPKPANVIIKDEANLYMDSNDARTKKPGVAVYLSSNMDQY